MSENGEENRLSLITLTQQILVQGLAHLLSQHASATNARVWVRVSAEA